LVGRIKEKVFTGIGKIFGLSAAEVRSVIAEVELEEQENKKLKAAGASSSSRQESQLVELSDFGFCTPWSPSDEEHIDKLFARIRAGLEPPDSFEQKLQRIYDDKKTGTNFESSSSSSGGTGTTTKFEPAGESSRSDDLVTNRGLARFCQLAVGKPKNPSLFLPNSSSPTPFPAGVASGTWIKYVASGTGGSFTPTGSTKTASEVRGMNLLVSENHRISIITDGYGEIHGGTIAGATMKIAGRFSPTVPSAEVRESGAFDMLPIVITIPETGLLVQYGGLLFYRTNYDTRPIQHVQHQTMYTITQSISFFSVF
jgi:hypothetical protein